MAVQFLRSAWTRIDEAKQNELLEPLTLIKRIAYQRQLRFAMQDKQNIDKYRTEMADYFRETGMSEERITFYVDRCEALQILRCTEKYQLLSILQRRNSFLLSLWYLAKFMGELPDPSIRFHPFGGVIVSNESMADFFYRQLSPTNRRHDCRYSSRCLGASLSVYFIKDKSCARSNKETIYLNPYFSESAGWDMETYNKCMQYKKVVQEFKRLPKNMRVAATVFDNADAMLSAESRSNAALEDFPTPNHSAHLHSPPLSPPLPPFQSPLEELPTDEEIAELDEWMNQFHESQMNG